MMTDITDEHVRRVLHDRKVDQVRRGYADREVAGLAALALDLLSVCGSRPDWDEALYEELQDRMSHATELLDLPSMFDQNAWVRLRQWMISN